MIIYKLKEDWSFFKAGEKFTASSYGNLYQLVNDDGKLVLAKIPTDLLAVVGGGYVWRPNGDDEYHYIDSDGAVLNEEYYIRDDYTDKGRLAIGNCFKTAQEANSACDWLKARQRLIESGARFINSRDINASENCFNVYFSVNERELMVNDVFLGKNVVFSRELCFDDKQLAERSIEEHKDDWLTYLGVKEKNDERTDA